MLDEKTSKDAAEVLQALQDGIIAVKDMPSSPQELERMLQNVVRGFSDAQAGLPARSKYFAYAFGYSRGTSKPLPEDDFSRLYGRAAASA